MKLGATVIFCLRQRVTARIKCVEALAKLKYQDPLSHPTRRNEKANVNPPMGA